VWRATIVDLSSLRAIAGSVSCKKRYLSKSFVKKAGEKYWGKPLSLTKSTRKRICNPKKREESPEVVI